MANKTLTFKADLLPNSNLGYSLGSSSLKWNVYGTFKGNADTATKLATARTINGTSFDGSANITTTNWGTARNISISDSDASNTGTAVSVNGSAAVTLKLPATIKATLKGNADTATKATQDGSGNTITSTYAKLASPTFTGTPKAPTAATGTNTTQLATTAFVQAAITAALNNILYDGSSTNL